MLGVSVETMKRAALSASRAKDFTQCPLMFRLRVIDKIPEPPSSAATKGTLVHSVLENLYDLPAAERSSEVAERMVDVEWAALAQKRPEVQDLFPTPGELSAWLAQARALVHNYFRMENPRRLEPAARERFVEVEISDGLLLRGFIDRIDKAPNGAVRVVDYKTGKAPSERFADDALFQMRFYALMMWRLDGVIPARLQLIYLGDGRTLSLDPHEDELIEFEARLEGLWNQIEALTRSGEFPPQRSALCSWCNFQEYCPLFGGETPPISSEGAEALLSARMPAQK